MEDISKKLGKRIQEVRKLRGLTQSQLAEKINVEVVTISRIENGLRFPKKENLENIAETLKVEMKDLFDFGHFATKVELNNSIRAMLKKSKIEDLQYVHKLLQFYFESKNKN